MKPVTMATPLTQTVVATIALQRVAATACWVRVKGVTTATMNRWMHVMNVAPPPVAMASSKAAKHATMVTAMTQTPVCRRAL